MRRANRADFSARQSTTTSYAPKALRSVRNTVISSSRRGLVGVNGRPSSAATRWRSVTRCSRAAPCAGVTSTRVGRDSCPWRETVVMAATFRRSVRRASRSRRSALRCGPRSPGGLEKVPCTARRRAEAFFNLLFAPRVRVRRARARCVCASCEARKQRHFPGVHRIADGRNRVDAPRPARGVAVGLGRQIASTKVMRPMARAAGSAILRAARPARLSRPHLQFRRRAIFAATGATRIPIGPYPRPARAPPPRRRRRRPARPTTSSTISETPAVVLRALNVHNRKRDEAARRLIMPADPRCATADRHGARRREQPRRAACRRSARSRSIPRPTRRSSTRCFS
jgi:hypothetical protein